MATISFTVFMILGFLLTLVINPKNKIHPWLYSIIIPIGLLLITVVIFGKGETFLMGQIFSQCLIATISTFILMAVLLIRKLKKSKNEDKVQ